MALAPWGANPDCHGDQLDLYLRLGLDSGLTRVQIAEALTHVGFYAGWPKATKALTAAAATLGK